MEQSLQDTESIRKRRVASDAIQPLVKRLTEEHDEVVYLDTEYIHAALAENRYRPTEQDWTEVVQIGAVKWNHRLHQASDTFIRLVRPKIHLHDMNDAKIADFEKITPLKWTDILEQGIDFPKVYDDLKTFIGGLSVVVMLGDGFILRKDCESHKLEIIGSLVDPTRLKPLLREIDDVYYSKIWSGMLYLEVGATTVQVLSSTGSADARSEHDGLFDATSMAIFVDKMAVQ